MKERYYGLVNTLKEAKDFQMEPLAYDAEHERRRKEQLIKLWNRTEEQVLGIDRDSSFHHRNLKNFLEY